MRKRLVGIVFCMLMISSTATLISLSFPTRGDDLDEPYWDLLYDGEGFGTLSNDATRGIVIFQDNLYIGTMNENFFPKNLEYGGFSASTLITMKDSSTKRIDRIRVGDMVKVYDFDREILTSACVTSLIRTTPANSPSSVVRINNRIYASPYQLYFVNDTMKTAETLNIGDQMIDSRGLFVTVTDLDVFNSNRNIYYSFTVNEEISQLGHFAFFAQNIQVYPWVPPTESEDEYVDSECLESLFPLAENLGNQGWTKFFNNMVDNKALNSDGGELWKYNPTIDPTWSIVIGDGCVLDFGEDEDSYKNWAVSALTVFKGKLYVGTWRSKTGGGCQIYRFDGTTWELVVPSGFGDLYNVGVMCMKEFHNALYVGTMNYNFMEDGFTQIWRSDSGNVGEWNKVIDRGFRYVEKVGENVRNFYTWSMEVFQDQFYIGVCNIPFGSLLGCQLYRTSTGNPNPAEWEIVPIKIDDVPYYYGAGEEKNDGIRNLINWNDQYLYVGITTDVAQLRWQTKIEALEIWRYAGGENWACMVGDNATNDPRAPNYDGFGDIFNKYPYSMFKCGGKLWVGTCNLQVGYLPFSNGCEIWRLDNTGWVQVVGNRAEFHPECSSGFGYDHNIGARSMIEYPQNTGQLVVGTYCPNRQYAHPPHACEIWIRYL